MDHGTLTDNNGRKADFRNVIIIMTTNAGAESSAQGARSASPTRREAGRRDGRHQAHVHAGVPQPPGCDDHLRARSTRRSSCAWSTSSCCELEEQLHEKKVEADLHATSCASSWRKKGFDPLMGARPMARLIQDTIRKALADELLFGRLVGRRQGDDRHRRGRQDQARVRGAASEGSRAGLKRSSPVKKPRPQGRGFLFPASPTRTAGDTGDACPLLEVVFCAGDAGDACPSLEVVFCAGVRGRRVSAVRSRLLCRGRGRCVSGAPRRKRRPTGPGAPFARAPTAFSRAFRDILQVPRSSAPPVTAATPSRTGHASPASSRRQCRCVAARTASRESRVGKVARTPGCCHESAPACRGSRQRAARTTGSAGRSGWRVRARRAARRNGTTPKTR